ncbi:MAG: DUF1702 family protein [Acidobacteriota bacterium]
MNFEISPRSTHLPSEISFGTGQSVHNDRPIRRSQRLAKTFKKAIFGVSPREVSFDRRGFVGGTPAVRARLEHIAATFLAGYHAGLQADAPEHLPQSIAAVDDTHRGFAVEGAAMAFAALDAAPQMLPLPIRLRRGPLAADRFRRFLDGPGEPYLYMSIVGAGGVLHRLPPIDVDRMADRLHPLFGWLAVDGFGFHYGLFDTADAFESQRRPRRVRSAAARQAFDQGLGRVLWFASVADPRRVAERIEGFDPSRRDDLWSGVGLAACYACGTDHEALAALRRAAGDHRVSLAQGATFAAEARRRGGFVPEHSEMACRILTGLPVGEAATITDTTRPALDATVPPGDTLYQTWRRWIREALATEPRTGLAPLPTSMMSPSMTPAYVTSSGGAALRVGSPR